jgi:hypothetical protein
MIRLRGDHAQNKPQQKKAARLPGRPFLSHGSPTLEGDLRMSSTGGLSPGRILIGCRCASGRSRAVSRTSAMVSHLRKMTLSSLTLAICTTARWLLSPLLPLSTAARLAAPQQTGRRYAVSECNWSLSCNGKYGFAMNPAPAGMSADGGWSLAGGDQERENPFACPQERRMERSNWPSRTMARQCPPRPSKTCSSPTPGAIAPARKVSGLACIASQVAQAHRGTLQAPSNDEATRFAFEMPAAKHNRVKAALQLTGPCTLLFKGPTCTLSVFD